MTLLLSLSDVTAGGETVFPFALNQSRTDDEYNADNIMPECSKGLAIQPKKLQGVLFYSQTGENEEDLISRHGGCPPAEGEIKCKC